MEEVQEVCEICKLQDHITQNFTILLAFKEVLNKQANAINSVPQPVNNPYLSI